MNKNKNKIVLFLGLTALLVWAIWPLGVEDAFLVAGLATIAYSTNKVRDKVIKSFLAAKAAWNE